MEGAFTSLDNSVIGCEVEFHPAAESTNTLAAEAMRQGRSEGATFIADFQTRGRGQRGNFWESRAGDNLTFSVLVYPTFLQVFDHFYLSKVVSNGVAEALAGLGVCAEVKWPNDIYVGRSKVAGILIENGLMGAQVSSSIWGIGLNVNQDRFESSAPNPASLKAILGHELSRSEVLQAVLRCIDGWYARLRSGDLAAIDAFYFGVLFRREGYFEYDSEQYGRFRARIADVERTGELVLETEGGERRSFAFKEVSFIL